MAGEVTISLAHCWVVTQSPVGSLPRDWDRLCLYCTISGMELPNGAVLVARTFGEN